MSISRFLLLLAAVFFVAVFLGRVLPWDGIGWLKDMWPTYIIPWDDAESGPRGMKVPYGQSYQGVLFLFPIFLFPVTLLILGACTFIARGALVSLDVHICCMLVSGTLLGLCYFRIPWAGGLYWQAMPYVLLMLIGATVATAAESMKKKTRIGCRLTLPVTVVNSVCLLGHLMVLPWIAGV